MVGILDIAKNALLKNANPQGIYVDFTMGRGRDTLFLSTLAPQGKVFAFDIQPSALEQTAELLAQNNVTNVKLILASHHRLLEFVTEPIDGGLFNLGYLPGGDRTLTTNTNTTLEAVKIAMNALKPKGILAIAIYPGHPEGRLEGELLENYFKTVNKKLFDIFIYRLINVEECPYMLVMEKRQ